MIAYVIAPLLTDSLVANDQKGLVETKRYKDFSEYIRDVSKRNRPGREQSKDDVELDTEFKALYDIYPETDGLRQTRDIKDEVKMIKKIIDNQETVIKVWHRTGGDYYDFLGKRKNLEKIDEEAEGVEKRVARQTLYKIAQTKTNAT